MPLPRMVWKLVSRVYPVISLLTAVITFLTASPQTRILVLPVLVQKLLSGRPTAERPPLSLARLENIQLVLVTLTTRVIQLLFPWIPVRPPVATEKNV